MLPALLLLVVLAGLFTLRNADQGSPLWPAVLCLVLIELLRIIPLWTG
jgi:hypothetical protein